MSLDETKEGDVEEVVDGIEFVVDDATFNQFGAVIVDFSSGFLGKRFYGELCRWKCRGKLLR